jgi:hypothetical protein
MTTKQIAEPKMETLKLGETKDGAGNIRRAYDIAYSFGLARDSEGKVIVNVTRDQAREIAKAAGYRLSTASEEYELSENGIEHVAFNDAFGRNPEHEYFWNHTDTGLLKPKGQKSDYVKKEKGRTYHLRIVTEGGKKVGEIWVPEGNGKTIREWSVFGLPTETVDGKEHKDGTETHFYFEPSLEEIAVLRRRRWRDAHEHCFGLRATGEPSRSYSSGSFRLVRGSLPEYEGKVISPVKENEDYRRGYEDGEKSGLETGYEKARQEFLQKPEKFRKELE